jgi:hypothetical protein
MCDNKSASIVHGIDQILQDNLVDIVPLMLNSFEKLLIILRLMFFGLTIEDRPQTFDRVQIRGLSGPFHAINMHVLQEVSAKMTSMLRIIILLELDLVVPETTSEEPFSRWDHLVFKDGMILLFHYDPVNHVKVSDSLTTETDSNIDLVVVFHCTGVLVRSKHSIS